MDRNPKIENGDKFSTGDVSYHVGLNATLAASIQIATNVRPGSIHRFHNFGSLTIENYLTSSILLNQPMREIAKRGIMAEKGYIELDEVDMGWIMSEAMKQSKNWHSGGIMNVGPIFLFSPIAAAAGYILSENLDESDNKNIINNSYLRDTTNLFIENTTPEDTVNLVSALHNISQDRFSFINNFGSNLPEAIDYILEEEIDLQNFYNMYFKENLIFEEINNKYEICFGKGITAFYEALNEGLKFVDAITHAYVTILSLKADSLISKKYGRNIALDMKLKANEIMDYGGFLSPEGRELIIKLDKEIHNIGDKMDPLDIADLTTCVTFISTLNGTRP